MDAARFWTALASSIEITLTSSSSESAATCMKVLNKAIESKVSKIAKSDRKNFFNIFFSNKSLLKGYDSSGRFPAKLEKYSLINLRS